MHPKRQIEKPRSRGTILAGTAGERRSKIRFGIQRTCSFVLAHQTTNCEYLVQGHILAPSAARGRFGEIRGHGIVNNELYLIFDALRTTTIHFSFHILYDQWISNFKLWRQHEGEGSRRDPGPHNYSALSTISLPKTRHITMTT
jgi:hypothetical protein